MEKFLKVEVYRASDNKLVYGNTGSGEMDRFDDDLEKYKNDEYKIIKTDMTSEFNNSENKMKRRKEYPYFMDCIEAILSKEGGDPEPLKKIIEKVNEVNRKYPLVR